MRRHGQTEHREEDDLPGRHCGAESRQDKLEAYLPVRQLFRSIRPPGISETGLSSGASPHNRMGKAGLTESLDPSTSFKTTRIDILPARLYRMGRCRYQRSIIGM